MVVPSPLLDLLATRSTIQSANGPNSAFEIWRVRSSSGRKRLSMSAAVFGTGPCRMR